MNSNVRSFGKWFYCRYCTGMVWFRLFGVGLLIKDSNKHPLLFSERMGYTGVMFGKWLVKYLNRD